MRDKEQEDRAIMAMGAIWYLGQELLGEIQMKSLKQDLHVKHILPEEMGVDFRHSKAKARD